MGYPIQDRQNAGTATMTFVAVEGEFVGASLKRILPLVPLLPRYQQARKTSPILGFVRVYTRRRYCNLRFRDMLGLPQTGSVVCLN